LCHNDPAPEITFASQELCRFVDEMKPRELEFILKLTTKASFPCIGLLKEIYTRVLDDNFNANYQLLKALIHNAAILRISEEPFFKEIFENNDEKRKSILKIFTENNQEIKSDDLLILSLLACGILKNEINITKFLIKVRGDLLAKQLIYDYAKHVKGLDLDIKIYENYTIKRVFSHPLRNRIFQNHI